MKIFKEFVITVSPYQEELISGVLWQLDIDGVTEDAGVIKVYCGESGNTDKSKIEGLLEQLRGQKLIDSFAVEESTIEDRNWNEEWEKTINIIEVSDRIVIKPSFRSYTTDDSNKIILTIDPKMSFGTGEHQTTKLMINMVEKYVKPGMSVLDAGTGTGVLAIAAVKLGAAEAVAFDNDEWCYENGIENAEQNAVSDKVKILNCELDDIDIRPFDLVLANINKNILIDIAEGLVIRLSENGTLVLSGLLFTDEEDITDKFVMLGLRVIDKMQMDEWISLTFRKR
ncbi:MAG: 50S ribosomal protein L11 methyltransferase [Bacteroidota bacterium]